MQRGVLQSPRLTDLEIENFAAMTNVSQEVLRIISKNRNFMKSYVVIKNLTKNPKSPLDVTLHLLPSDAWRLETAHQQQEYSRDAPQFGAKLERQRNGARLSS